MDGVSRVISTQHPDSPLRMAALVDRVPEQKLHRMVAGNSSDRFEPINEFLKGLTHLRAGRNRRAIEHLNLASKYSPDNAAILNNLGVALHGLGRYGEARTVFGRALESGPREAVIHYNLSQTLNALLYYDLAQQELSKASMLNFELTRSLVTSENPGRLVPMNLQKRVLWKLAMDSRNHLLDVSYHPVEAGIGGSILLVLAAAACLFLARHSRFPARCDICGNHVRSQIVKRKRKEILCDKCTVIKQGAASDNKLLEEKLEARLKRMETGKLTLRIALGLLMPGITFHIGGQRLNGILACFIVVGWIALLMSGGTFVKPIPHFNVDHLTGWLTPGFLIVYGVYAWRSTVLAIRSVREE
jgi:hypothetical protein